MSFSCIVSCCVGEFGNRKDGIRSWTTDFFYDIKYDEGDDDEQEDEEEVDEGGHDDCHPVAAHLLHLLVSLGPERRDEAILSEVRGEKDILHVGQSNIQGALQLVYQVGCVTNSGQSLRVVIEQRDIEGQDNMVFLRSSLYSLDSRRS